MHGRLFTNNEISGLFPLCKKTTCGEVNKRKGQSPVVGTVLEPAKSKVPEPK